MKFAPRLVFVTTQLATVLASQQVLAASDVCSEIAKEISSESKVFYPGHLSYREGIEHYSSASEQESACTVEPSSAQDVSVIFRIIAQHRTPFAVKGGGHATNQGFSSTTGVQIYMRRFNDVNYNQLEGSVTFGAGLKWEEVYEALEPWGVSVVGGRVPGIGVAGLALGGGYGWRSNQFGLTCDSILEFELVTPDGQIRKVNQQNDLDLFVSLKGGGNNFGIVTRFTMQTFQQPLVWGGLAVISGEHLEAVVAATADFDANVKDPKAAIITNLSSFQGNPLTTILMFYDGPQPPTGIFKELTAIPTLQGFTATMPFATLINSFPTEIIPNTQLRVAFASVPLNENSKSVLEFIAGEGMHWGSKLMNSSSIYLSYAIEPFLPSLLTNAATPSLFPPTRIERYLPLNILFSWLDPSQDQVVLDAIEESQRRIWEVAGGKKGMTQYPNYAGRGTGAEQMFGAEGVKRARAVRTRVDPEDVMGLTGGFKF